MVFLNNAEWIYQNFFLLEKLISCEGSYPKFTLTEKQTVSVPGDVSDLCFPLTSFVGDDFIKLSKDGCDMFNKQTQTILTKMASSSSLKLTNTKTFYTLNTAVGSTDTTHVFYFLNSSSNVKMIVYFNIDPSIKGCMIKNILSECDKIDETAILENFMSFFKNKHHNLFVEVFSSPSQKENFSKFLFIKQGLFYSNLMDVRNLSNDFCRYNACMSRVVKAVTEFQTEHTRQLQKSRDDFLVHTSNFKKIGKLPVTQYVNNYILKFDQKYEIQVNGRIFYSLDPQRDNFLIDFKGIFETDYKQSILKNSCWKYNYYLTKDGDVKIFILSDDYVSFVAFLKELGKRDELIDYVSKEETIFQRSDFPVELNLLIKLFKNSFETDPVQKTIRNGP